MQAFHSLPVRQAAAARPSRRVIRLPRAAAPNAAAATNAAAGSWTSSSQSQSSSSNAVHRLYDAINRRDVASLPACFADDVQYQNLAFADTLTGMTAVTRFYQESMRALPPGAEVQLEQQAGLNTNTTPGQQARTGSSGSSSSSSSAAVVWRLVLPDSGTTVSRGVAFFSLDPAGLITAVTDSPEHPVKLSARGLSVFGPLVQGLAGPMLPAVQGLGRAMQQGVDLLLQPLEGMMGQSDGSTASGADSWATDTGSSAGGSSSSSSSSGWAAAPGLSGSTPSSYAGRSSSSSSSGGPPGSLQTARGSWGGASSAAAAAAPAAAAAGSGVGRRPVAVAAAAAGPSVGAAGGAAEQQQPNFSGLWVKVPERSDTVGYESALDVLGLSGLQKVTARLIDGLDIAHSPTRFTVNFVTVVPFFRVTEDVPLDGGSTQLGRRDLRFGRQATAARSVPGGVLVEMSWGAPMAGTLTEQYTLTDDGCLCVEADTRVGDRSAHSTSVYRRSGGSRDELLSDSRKRNPSVAAVLQQQKQQGLDV